MPCQFCQCLEKDDIKGVYFLIWGGAEAFASNYPDVPTAADKNEAEKYFTALRGALPCSVCKFHYSELLIHSPPRLGSREELLEWLIETHNDVNRRTGKPVLSLAEAKKKIQENQNTSWTEISKLRDNLKSGQVTCKEITQTSSCSCAWWIFILLCLVGLLLGSLLLQKLHNNQGLFSSSNEKQYQNHCLSKIRRYSDNWLGSSGRID